MERHINCELYILRDQFFPTETEVKQIHFLLQWKMPQDTLGALHTGFLYKPRQFFK